ncbi:thymidylate synthase [Brevibacillus sp. LEMMJ03]
MSRFVLPTTRRIYIRSVVHELLWFPERDTNIRYLNK